MPPNPLKLIQAAKTAAEKAKLVRLAEQFRMQEADKLLQLARYPSQTPLKPTTQQLEDMLNAPLPSTRGTWHELDGLPVEKRIDDAAGFAGGGLVKAIGKAVMTLRDLPFRGNGALDVAKLTPEHLALLEKMSAADKRLVFRATPEEGLKPVDSGFEGLFAGKTAKGVLPYSEGTNLQGGSAPTLHMLKLDQPHSEFKSFNLLKPTDSTYSDPSALMNDIQWGVRNGRSFEELYEMLQSQGAGLTKTQLKSALTSKGLRFHNNPNLVDSALTGEIGLFDPSTAGGTPATRLVGPDLEPYAIKYAGGGHVGMEHTRSSGQDASTQPVDSQWRAALRSYLAGTAGLPGDLEGLARQGVNAAFGLGGVKVDETPVLPTTEFYKDWLPGKQEGSAPIADLASMLGGVGMVKGIRSVESLGKAVAHAAPGPVAGGKLAQLGVIRNIGDNNFLKGSVENALSGLKTNPPTLRGRGMFTDEGLADFSRQDATNKFVEGPLTRYVKNQMATPDDPVRALAEQGVLHIQPNEMIPIDPPGFIVSHRREAVGLPRQGLAKSDLAKRWEVLSDSALESNPAKRYVESDKRFGGNKTLQDNSWIATKPPETPILSTQPETRDLGLDHLTDELRNALNPESGLPRNLLLTPEKMANMGMERAVRHVAAINDWREQAALTARKAAAEGIPVRKEYPHTPETPNPQGLRWLTIPDTAQDEKALKFACDVGKQGAWCTQVADAAKRYGSEGNQLHVLVDAKGDPHVQIMTSKGLDPEYLRAGAEADIRRMKPLLDDESDEFADLVDKQLKSLQSAGPDVPSIVQIKRKANLVNSEPYEYRPFVQDFVKSGKWSDVGDLPNVGLRPTKEAFNTNELKKIRDAGHEVPEWASPDEINALGNAVWPNQWGKYGNDVGFATGGRVSMIHPAAAIQPLVRVPGFDRF